MVEIKLDDPMKHIKDADDCFIIHQSLDQYMSHATHATDKEWAVIHKKIFNMTMVDEDRFDTLLNKYFETGELSKSPEPKPQEPRRKRFQIMKNNKIRRFRCQELFDTSELQTGKGMPSRWDYCENCCGHMFVSWKDAYSAVRKKK